VSTGEEALEIAGRCHLMLMDVRLPGVSGLEAARSILVEHPSLPIILLTAFIDLRDAVNAVKWGARDYLEKPVDLDELVAAVDDILEQGGRPVSRPEMEDLPEGVIAESPAMRRVFGEAARAAATDATVLLLGESGTGKDVVASFIHERSERSGRPLVRVNCGALPANLIESELFGHERGAFTGAESTRKGRFEAAEGGTIFLDEVAELPLELQPKLLHVLESGSFRRVGGSRELRASARVIAATNRPLEEAVRQGGFREDLYYRINVVAISIPPLRERRDDILPMAERMLAGRRLRLSPAAERALMSHDWPGNVRELKNSLERASIMTDGEMILPEDLPPQIRKAPEPAPAGSVLVGDMQTIQRHAILEALERTGGNKTQAAQLLGISRRNLIYKLREYGL
ncbi:MAG: sigma-54-dependent transcriptional regulator, partial [Myxococcota bacterium]